MLFFGAVAFETLHEFFKVDLVSVKLWVRLHKQIWFCRRLITRQAPHMPMPSTMMGFRLAMVFMPYGRVMSAITLIIIGGPIAKTMLKL